VEEWEREGQGDSVNRGDGNAQRPKSKSQGMTNQQ